MIQRSDVMGKEVIRKETIRRLRDQNPFLRRLRSRRAQKKLLSSEEFRVSRTVMTYVSLPSEVDTRFLNEKALELGKRIAAPYISGSDSNKIIAVELTTLDSLEKGPFGIYQPKNGFARKIPLKEIDLVVVPAIAYDRNNMRLGRGKGYYDRFLASEELSSAKTIGLAFRFQVVSSLSPDPHDRPVSRVITD